MGVWEAADLAVECPVAVDLCHDRGSDGGPAARLLVSLAGALPVSMPEIADSWLRCSLLAAQIHSYRFCHVRTVQMDSVVLLLLYAWSLQIYGFCVVVDVSSMCNASFSPIPSMH